MQRDCVRAGGSVLWGMVSGGPRVLLDWGARCIPRPGGVGGKAWHDPSLGRFRVEWAVVLNLWWLGGPPCFLPALS